MNRNRHTALVTGGTSGIGRSIAQALVERGFFVHIVGTNAEKGARTLAELNATGVHARFWKRDLSEVRSVKAFAADFRAEVDRLDTLVNGAGVVLPTRKVTAEGHEATLAIDHLSAFVLSRDLEPLLANAPYARIVNVSGPKGQVLDTQLDFDDLHMEHGYTMTESVVKALHAKAVMTELLAERYQDRGIDVVAVDPGGVQSDVGRHLPLPMRVALRVMQWFMPRESVSAIYAATSDELTGKSGYFVAKRTATPLRFEEGYKQQLWSATEALVAPAARIEA